MNETKVAVVRSRMPWGRLCDAYLDATQRGRTALMDAVTARHEPAVVRLIAERNDVDAIAEGPESALSIACIAGTQHIARRLLAAGADPRMRLREDYTLLHVAAANGSLAMVTALVEAGAQIEMSHGHASPLATAIAHDHLEVLDYLLTLELGHSEPRAAFTAAAELGNVEALRRLEDRFGALGTVRELMAAAAGGHTRAVEYLIDRGVPVNEFDLKDERSPLMHAAEGGHLETARALLARGAGANAMTEWFVTPLRIAQQRRDAAMIELLREHGAVSKDAPALHVALPYATYTTAIPRPRPVDPIAAALASDDVAALAQLEIPSASSALRGAARANAFHCMALLLARGADPHEDRQDALRTAIRASNAHAVRMMLAAAPAALGPEISTAAVAQSDPWVLEAVLDAGAPIDRGRYGSPLSSAASEGRWPHVAILLARGAAFGEDLNSESPLTSAAAAGHARCVKLLVERELATGGLQIIDAPGPYRQALVGSRRIDIALRDARDPRVIEMLVAYGARRASLQPR